MTLHSVLYTGPANTDPLTDDELSILLAVPRAAQATPDAILFRLPRSPDPAMGWVDVTCAQVKSIVSRLAQSWNVALSGMMHKRSGGKASSIGPGTTVCILVQPPVNALFHHLAFWSLGCTVQYIMLALGERIVSRCLQESGCDVVLCAEEDLETQKLVEQLGVSVAVLPRSEYAINLATEEIDSPASHTPPWPEARRPSPAVIIHSSASTGDPKLTSFSLYYYTIGLANGCKLYLTPRPRKASKDQPEKGLFTHPRLVFNPPYWQSFYFPFIIHLVTATPMAFVQSSNVRRLSGSEIIAWVEGLDAGALVASAHRVREVILLGKHTALLQSLRHISMTGSSVDRRLSDLCEQYGLAITNLFGSSELAGLLSASRPPYDLLRPIPGAPPPLVVPISDDNQASAGAQLGAHPGREVQLWTSVSTSARLAHLAARGGVPLDLEPYPGDGPCHGELAVNWGDIFREIRVPKPGAEGETEIAYLHLGRSGDTIRVSSNGRSYNASEFEAELRPLLEARLAGMGDWRLDTVQLFGSNLPSTALAVQLLGEEKPDEALLQGVRESVEDANTKIGLAWPLKVDSHKRLLVLVKDPKNPIGHVVHYGEASADGAPKWDNFFLAQTHKHTIRRFKNEQAFQPWLAQLDWS